ncbi:unnamed protein product [Allacma fusca]|uniref:ENTH domain-containing protein n=1 Tax=Allacma fusca TaxID=39272 RepID=A0A8J2K0M1_9HEXA|nr:unnamed protein product [Allacma fusca]
MQVSVAGLRRNIKNIANNYTEPQKKVREATSNDPWGTPSTLMSEIADMTYNIEAFAQIMEMIWKRLNDHGKNWRHVYKSLVLLEYLIKTGSERVAQQCKENIFAIQTLKDFQYFEDNKDQGLNVREKAKQLVTLLSSEERLKNERARALKARERFAQTVSGFGSSDSNDTTPTSPVFTSNNFGSTDSNYAGAGSYTRHRTNSELEKARPETAGEEELQLQLALAMSKEEAEQEEKRRRSDDLRLQMALSQSEQEFKTTGPTPTKKENVSALLDLLDVELSSQAPLQIPGASMGDDPWAPAQPAARGDLWSGSNSAVTSPIDPWSPSANASSHSAPNTAAVASNDPWLTSPIPPPKQDMWTTNQSSATTPTFTGAIGGLEEDEFDTISKRPGLLSESSVFNMEHLSSSILQPSNTSVSPALGQSANKKTPVGFLGQNSSLVDLDNLLPSGNNRQASSPILGNLNSGVGMAMSSGSSSAPNVHNPFAPVAATSLLTTGSASQTVNPFHLQTAVTKPTINELREKQQQQQMQGLSQSGSFQPQAPLQPSVAQNNPWSPVKTENPFLN